MKPIDDLPDGMYSARFTELYKIQNMRAIFRHNPRDLMGDQVFDKHDGLWWWKWYYGMTSECIDESTVKRLP